MPILVRLTNRREEALHEALQDAMSKILPTMTPFVTTANIQVIIIIIIALARGPFPVLECYMLEVMTRHCLSYIYLYVG